MLPVAFSLSNSQKMGYMAEEIRTDASQSNFKFRLLYNLDLVIIPSYCFFIPLYFQYLLLFLLLPLNYFSFFSLVFDSNFGGQPQNLGASCDYDFTSFYWFTSYFSCSNFDKVPLGFYASSNGLAL